MANEKETAACSSRLGRVGGGALIEGVMMRAGTDVAITCRDEKGELHVVRETNVPLRKKHKWANIPLLRGVINFVEMLVLSMHTLNVSADVYAGEDENGQAVSDSWLYGVLSVLATVLGVVLALALFLWLPRLCVGGLEKLFATDFPGWLEGVIEGAIKVIVFILYIWAVTLIPDMRRTFQYHGAEHKSIACYEAGAELTPANAKRYTRFHPRCGTSFMFVMILLGILIGIALRYILPPDVIGNSILYTLIRLLLLPVVVGIGFEFIMYAGKHPNLLSRILSAPGLWMQRLTTKEPDESMLEVAIISLKTALLSEFPDFDPTVYEKKPADAAENAENGAPVPQDPGEPTEETPASDDGKTDA